MVQEKFRKITIHIQRYFSPPFPAFLSFYSCFSLSLYSYLFYLSALNILCLFISLSVVPGSLVSWIFLVMVRNTSTMVCFSKFSLYTHPSLTSHLLFSPRMWISAWRGLKEMIGICPGVMMPSMAQSLVRYMGKRDQFTEIVREKE